MSHDKANPFENIEMANKCPINWKDMEGSECVRKCTDCLLNVYDLANHSEPAAMQIISENEMRRPDDLFMLEKLYRRSDGKFMVKNCPASFLRNLLGPSHNEIWRQFSDDIKASYVAYDGEGHFAAPAFVTVKHDIWDIRLDVYLKRQGKSEQPYTRIRCPFSNPGKLRFTIYPKTVFSELGKLFGMQDILIPWDTKFDRDFIVKGNSESKIRELLQDDNLRHLLIALNKRACSVTHGSKLNYDSSIYTYEMTTHEKSYDAARNLREPVNELYFEAYGSIRDKVVLKEILELFIRTLERLRKIAAA